MNSNNLDLNESFATGEAAPPDGGRLMLGASLLWSFWLTLEYWALGDLSYLHYHDNADQIIPLFQWLTMSAERMNGAEQIPVMCGVDRFACSAWINAFNLPFLFLPGWAANGLILFVQRFVACWFTMRVAREVIRMPLWTAVVVGLVYPLLPFEHGELRLMHGLNEPGLPFLIWLFATWRFAGWAKLIGVAVLSGFALSMCMGPISAMPFFLPTAVLIALITRSDYRNPGAWLPLILFTVLLLLAYVPMQLPTLKSILSQAGGGHRADWGATLGFAATFKNELMANAKQLIAIGWTVLLLLPCLLGPRGQARRWIALFALVLIGFLLGPAMEAFAKSQGDWIGVLQGFNFARFNRVLPLAFLLAAGLGLSRWQEWLGRDSAPLWCAVAVTVVAAGSWNLKTDHWKQMREEGKSWRTTLGNRDVAAIPEIAKGQDPFRVATAGAYHLFHPQFWMQHDLEMADGYMVMYPERYQKFWNKVVGPLVETQAELTGHFSRWGSRVYLFHSRDPADAFRPDVPYDEWYNGNLLSLINTRFIISKKPMQVEGMNLLPAAVTDAEHEAWLARGAAGKVKGYLKGENPGRRYYIYENPSAFPRAFAVERLNRFDDTELLYDAMADASLETLRSNGFVLNQDVAKIELPENGDGDASVAWLDKTDNGFLLQVDAGRETVLMVSTLYYDKWQVVDVNGAPLPTFPVDGAFLGILVPAGKTMLMAEVR